MGVLRARFQARATDAKLTLGSAFETQDMAEIVRVSHILSGSGALFGFPAISIAAERVELAAESGDQAALETLLPELLGLLEDAVQER
jgi:HPt (histidine-containing phosphotransfer) domain-containing protein